MSMLRKIQRVGKRATKFQYTATYQSVVIECLRDKWHPTTVCVSWTRRGRRLISKARPWQPSPDNKMRGVVIWPDPESVEITVTLYKGPKDKSYETKEWEFAVIDVDNAGKRKVLATTSINMVRYASSMPFETDLTLRLKPVSRKIKSVILQVTLTSMFLKEGKATDDDMMSIASMMSISNLSTIGFLEDEEDDQYYWTGGRSVSPPSLPDHILSTDQLLNWAREVTKDTRSVKITNMTTSWRNGIGFLAIMHYHRPDLIPDFDMLSPTSIKENNRLAFELARSLGVACPLTPNMMVTTTVPDKLAVTSFVYQLHQYFTKATQSAVAKAEGRTGSGPTSPTGSERAQSPFDISQIPEMFSGKLSPVTTAPPSDKVLNVYSRHSRDNSQVDIANKESSETSNVIEDTASVNSASSEHMSTSPASRAKLQLDLLVSEHAPVSSTPVTKREGARVAQPEVADSSGEDRVVEYENTESSEPLTTETTSSHSAYDDDEGLSYPELPLDPKPIFKESSPSNVSLTGSGRKLPSPPRDADSEDQVAKREERRKQAQEMLKRHKIKINRSADQIKAKCSSSSDSKYRQQAIQMLSEAFNTPKGSRKTSLHEDSLASESSASSLSAADDSPSMKRHYSTGSIGIRSPVRTEGDTLPAADTTADFRNEENTGSTYSEEVSTYKHKGLEPRRVSDSNLLKQTTSSGPKQIPRSIDRRNSETSLSSPSSDQPKITTKRVLSQSGRPSSTATSAEKRKKRQLPTVRPVPAEPSQTLVRLAEQKKKEEEKAREAAARATTEALALEQKSQVDTGLEEAVSGDGDEELTESQDDQTEVVPKKTARQSRVTPVHKKSLPSPAWSQQSDDLSQDLLVTQSEYVKTELLGLRGILVSLEDKAGNMELRVREAMSDGDKEKEEELMQEWFGLLNKKNELIKRQIELNMIEKEEDLEKRQFFINRELRPLMEIPDDKKTEQQKERAGQLLGQLLELIDERDKLERKKLSAERSSDHERTSLASAQANTADIVHTDYPGRQSKDCVIS